MVCPQAQKALVKLRIIYFPRLWIWLLDVICWPSENTSYLFFSLRDLIKFVILSYKESKDNDTIIIFPFDHPSIQSGSHNDFVDNVKKKGADDSSLKWSFRFCVYGTHRPWESHASAKKSPTQSRRGYSFVSKGFQKLIWGLVHLLGGSWDHCQHRKAQHSWQGWTKLDRFFFYHFICFLFDIASPKHNDVRSFCIHIKFKPPLGMAAQKRCHLKLTCGAWFCVERPWRYQGIPLTIFIIIQATLIL